jgi:hypothetical protein
VQSTKFKKFNINDMVKAFNKKDICSIKFINLARQLRDNKLNDEKQGNLICLANIKICITKIIKL